MTELLKRSRCAVVIMVPRSVDGEDYSHTLYHQGHGWECRGLVEQARDVIKSRLPGNYTNDK